MCAENAQVILCYLEESHRPSRNNQTQQTPNTQKQPNNTGPGLGKGRLFVSCKCETNLRRGETGAIELSKTDSHYSMRMSHCSKFGLQAFEMLRNITKHRVAFAVPFALGTVPGDPGIVTMVASLLKRLGRPNCRFISCACKIGRHGLENHGGQMFLPAI